MPTMSSPVPAPTSTSAQSATPSTSTTSKSLTVRPLAALLKAVPAGKQESGKQLPSGQVVFPNEGDYIISRGDQVIDVCDNAVLERSYLIVQEGLFLNKSATEQIEALTGIGSTKDPATLIHAIDRLAKIEIGGVKIQFTPGQLEEIKRRAEKRGYTVAQELARIVERIKDEIFFKS